MMSESNAKGDAAAPYSMPHQEPEMMRPAHPEVGACPEISPEPYCLTLTQRALKRTVDIVGALAFFVLLGPLYLLVAAAVLIGMGGPVHYGQTRLGHGGRPFRCYKFRSMVKGADQVLERHLAHDAAARIQWEQFQKLETDPRITPVGRVIRRLSLDELPQFYNVLKGDMSLVGPRPCMVRQRSLYGQSWPHYCHMRPGITGLWQVSGRSAVGYRERIGLQLQYVERWTLGRDLGILLRTVPAVLAQQGAH